MTTENIFEKGCLIQFSVSYYRGKRKLSKEIMEKVSSKTDWVRGNKNVINPKHLEPFREIYNQAKGYIETITVPFPIRGLDFIPKEKISEADAMLEGFKSSWQPAVEKFDADFSEIKQEAKTELESEGLYDDQDYPLDVRSKFNFGWRFVVVDTPNQNASVLSPALYEKEKEKFVELMQDAQNMAINALRSEFSGMVDKLVSRCSTEGKPKRLHKSLATKFFDFFETFKTKDIFKDDDLKEIIEQAKSVLEGKDLEKLNMKNEDLKAELHEGMSKVQEQLNKLFDKPRRQIALD